MPFGLEPKTLNAIAQHTTSTLAAILSFSLVTFVVRVVLKPGLVVTFIEDMDQFVLLMLVLWIVYQTGLVLWKTRVKFPRNWRKLKIPNGNELLSLVA
jgi:hypothetical protein